jgi:hypothetical protein
MVELLSGPPAHTVGFTLSGKLPDGDRKQFVPLADAAIARDGVSPSAKAAGSALTPPQ